MSFGRLRGSAKEPGAIRSLIMGSVCRKAVLTVLTAALVLGAVALVPAYDGLRKSFAAEMRQGTRDLVRTAIDPQEFPNLDRLMAIGDHLVRATDVTGGVYLSGIGELRGTFGEEPGLKWIEARVHGNAWRLSDDHSRFEMFFPPEATGTPYGLIVERDTGHRWAAALDRAVNALLFLLAAVVGLAAFVAVFVNRHVQRPLAILRNSVDFALNQPERAQKHLSQIARRDEIGQLSRALDQLLFFTANTVDDELAAAQAITEKNPHAIMTFSAEGHLLSANAAALRLFSARDVEALARRDPECLFRFGGEPRTAADLVSGGPAFGPGEIVLPGSTIPCLIGGDIVRRADGSPLRLFLVFVDVTSLVTDMREQVRQRQGADSEMNAMRDRLQRMRHLFDACLVLLELDNDSAPSGQPVTMSPDHFLDGWLSKAVTAGGMLPGAIAREELPPVMGDPDELRRLFSTVLDAIRLRSPEPTPSLRVLSALKQADQVTITIHTEPEDGSEVPCGGIASGEDVSLMLAAAAVLARRQGGRLVATSMDDIGNAVIFALPVDRHAMGTAAPEASAA